MIFSRLMWFALVILGDRCVHVWCGVIWLFGFIDYLPTSPTHKNHYTTYNTESLITPVAANLLQRCVVLCAVPVFVFVLKRCFPARQWHPSWAYTAQVHLRCTLLDSGTRLGPILFRVRAITHIYIYIYIYMCCEILQWRGLSWSLLMRCYCVSALVCQAFSNS